ncbi:MAG TPA: hypothetical protein VK116_02530, partial [Planctomycetota bacterium]|nr:hypothetical protein [Planctomycetota bacterium]
MRWLARLDRGRTRTAYFAALLLAALIAFAGSTAVHAQEPDAPKPERSETPKEPAKPEGAVSPENPAKPTKPEAGSTVRRLLYVATPGIRNYLDHGGHGIIVFSIDEGHRFVKRIPFGGKDADGKPLNVKGICASAETGRLWVTTLRHLISIDLLTEKVVWEREYEGGCDRMALSPDGKTIYLPTLEKEHWKVVDALDGREIARVTPDSGAHNTIWGPSGEKVYLAGLRSPLLTISSGA